MVGEGVAVRAVTVIRVGVAIATTTATTTTAIAAVITTTAAIATVTAAVIAVLTMRKGGVGTALSAIPLTSTATRRT